MRKFAIFAIMMSFFVGMMLVVSVDSTPAQTYVRKIRDRNGRIRYVRVKKPSYYRRHRNRINMALGTGGGAILGGLLGGKKGMLIGSGIGLGSSALYTYKIRPKKRHYKKVRRPYKYRRY